jgi:hemerythrin-like domain-containing protein
MSDALLLLRLEHENLSQLLDLIDEQRQIARTGGELDLDLLGTVAEYFGGYPDKCHHPVEDLVFQRLKMRDPGAVSDPDKLADEHAQIERLTAELAEAIAANDDEPGLAAVLEQFTNDYRKHMAMEEEHFFPAAARTLSEQDWDEIDFSLFDSPDPLFDHAAHERFHGLRDRINKLARSSQRRSARLRQVRQLNKLAGVEEFNAFLEAADYPYRLETRPEGGYTVMTGARPLVDIPACDAPQAIWCAYFFVQGLEEDPV